MENWYKKGNALLSEIHSTRLQPDELAFWFIGQCGFILKSDKYTVMIDPVLNDITRDDGKSVKNYEVPFAPCEISPDYVFCTHGHIDHLAGETVSEIAKSSPSTKFVIPAGCHNTGIDCGLPEASLILVKDGCDAALADGLRIRAFSAAHPTHTSDSNDPAMALGYCVELNGIRVVHLGDTYLTEQLLHSLEGLEPPHIFLPPINGDDRFRALRDFIGNMEAEEAAKLAIHLHADLSIPTHYDMIIGNTANPFRFPAELLRLSPAAKWHLPARGERFIYKLS